MAENEQKRCRVVLFLCPYEGHLNPMLQLGSVLQARGFSITVVRTEFNSPNPASHPHLSFHTIPHGLSEDEISSGDFVSIMSTLNTNCEKPLREFLAQMMEEQGDGRVHCIIYDPLMYCTEPVADHLGLPRIVLRTSSATNLVAYKAVFDLQKDGHIPLPDSMSLKPVPHLPYLRFKDLAAFVVPNVKELLQLLARSCLMSNSSGIIFNTLAGLEESSLAKLRQIYPVPFFPVGPLHKLAPVSSTGLFKEDTICLKWLDKQKHNSVIYVSMGSVAWMDEKQLVEMAWGLANSNQPFLWVIRPNLVRGSEKGAELLPPGYEEAIRDRGCIVQWAPQKKVLAHSAVGGFWSHCGWNSTLESISEGVPVICQPCFGDQRVNTRLLTVVWRVGLEFDSAVGREQVVEFVRRLMVEQEGKEMRQRAMDLKEKIEISLQDSGSSISFLNDLVHHISSL